VAKSEQLSEHLLCLPEVNPALIRDTAPKECAGTRRKRFRNDDGIQALFRYPATIATIRRFLSSLSAQGVWDDNAVLGASNPFPS
jgi:hypothetical protein